MEAGYFHPDRGYWQVIEKAGYEPPEGAVEVPLKPSGDHHWQDGAWVYVEPPVVPLPVDPLFEALDLIVAALNPASRAQIDAKLQEARAKRGVA